MKLLIANWREHQHYRHKSPPWIKLHIAMLDEYGPDGDPRKFRALPDRAKMLFPFLLLVAARYDGVLPTDSHEWLAKQTGLAPESIDTGDLIRAGLLVPATPSDGAGDTQGIRKGYAGDTQGIRIGSDSVATETEYRDRVQRQSTEGDARGITEPEPPSPPPPAPDSTPAPAVPPTAPDSAAPTTDTPPELETPPKGKQRAVKAPESASDAINRLRPVYAAIGVDVDRELIKCRAWCQAHGHGDPTVRRLVNWLNRADKSIGGATPASSVHRGMHETIKVREL